MLGLTEQVRGHDLGLGRLVGDHRDLRGAGEEVDGHLAEQLALGLGDVGVARADDHVDGLLVQESERHRGEGLDAAEEEGPVDTRTRRGVEHRGVGPAVGLRRRARDDRRDAGDLRHVDGHEGARRQGEASSGEVGADAADRHVAMSGDDARRQLGLEVLSAARAGHERRLRCARHRARSPRAGWGRAGRRSRGSVSVSSSTDRAREAVELAGVAEHGVHAVSLDGGQHLRDGGDHGGVSLSGGLVTELPRLDEVVSPLERRQDGRCVTHGTTV